LDFKSVGYRAQPGTGCWRAGSPQMPNLLFGINAKHGFLWKSTWEIVEFGVAGPGK